MRRALIAVYVHLIWATWDRLPLLDAAIERSVHRSIQAKARELGVDSLAVGDIEDHVHFLAGVPATLSVAALVQGVKGASAHLVTHELSPGSAFKWQGGYAAFSVSPRHIEQVREYIVRQREHHAANTPAIAWERRIFDQLRSSRTVTPGE
jgi:REP element-mobilizing transposase RayT